MQFTNLDINILYFLCNPVYVKEDNKSVRYADIVDAFSDIPEDQIRSTVRSMINDKLLRADPMHTRITVTPSGVDRLRGSIACKINQFSRCQCNR